MKKLKLSLIALVIIFTGLNLSVLSCKQTNNSYYPDYNWRTSTPEEQGVNSEKILKMFKNIISSGLDFHSLLIIRNGYIITEAYWAPYNKNVTHNIKSASKSILSSLVGIALEEGCLNNINQKVSEFYPEYVKDSLKKTITLHDLLTMTGGFEWMEDAGPSPFDLENWNKIPMHDKPGEIFEYNTMMTHMMSAILTKASGISTNKFAKKWLFEPLSIINNEWTKSNEGIYHGGSDIFLSPRDMAKFGYLYLRNGNWKDKQIVSEKWVKESTIRKVNIPSEDAYAKGLDYGYWWWIFEKGYMAWGAGGQYIIVRPDLDLVVVITSNGFENINRYDAFMKSFLEENIYSAIQSKTQLPANPTAVKELNYVIRDLENPQKTSVNLMTKTVFQISNKKYTLDPNLIGLRFSTLNFKDSTECTWEYSIGEKSVHLMVGTDGTYRTNKIPFSLGVRPDYEEIACKGFWKNNETFVIDHHIIGDPSRQLFELNFTDKTINIRVTTLGLNALIKGKCN
jgi:CubicO group peptidase (beta-lactamase class C family)